VLGDVKSFSSLLATQIKDTPLINRKTGETVEIVRKTAPDQILFQSQHDSGAVLSYHLRSDKPMPGNSALLWRIFGTEGELQVTAPSAYVNVGFPTPTISFSQRGAEKAVDVPVIKDEWEGLPPTARNIARQYEGFAKGDLTGIPDFEMGVKRHALIEEMLRRWDSGDQTSSAGLI
jgi:predicted dehydrogenase